MSLETITDVKGLKVLFFTHCKRSPNVFIKKLTDLPAKARNKLQTNLNLPKDDWSVSIQKMLEMVDPPKPTKEEKTTEVEVTPPKTAKKTNKGKTTKKTAKDLDFSKAENIIIKKEYESLVPPMEETKYEEFKDDIAVHGIRNPINILGDGTLLDGHHRVRACKELAEEGITVKLPFVIWRFTSDETIIAFIKSQNHHRRQIQIWQAARQAARHLPEIQKEVKAKQYANRKATLEGKKKKGEDVQKAAINIAGERFGGLSGSSVAQAKVVDENAPKSVMDELEKGDISLKKAYTITVQHGKNVKWLKELEDTPKVNFNSVSDVNNAVRDERKRLKEEETARKLKSQGRLHPIGPKEKECVLVLEAVQSIFNEKLNVKQKQKKIEKFIVDRINVYKEKGE